MFNQACNHGRGRLGVVPPSIFLCPPKFCCAQKNLFQTRNKNKNLAHINMYFALAKLKTWLQDWFRRFRNSTIRAPGAWAPRAVFESACSDDRASLPRWNKLNDVHQSKLAIFSNVTSSFRNHTIKKPPVQNIVMLSWKSWKISNVFL